MMAFARRPIEGSSPFGLTEGPATEPAARVTATGRSASIMRTTSVWGNQLASITVRTEFCYNFSTVTYAASTKSFYVFALGSLTMVWQGWASYDEHWYTLTGHIKAGIVSQAQGNFGQCVIEYGCLVSIYPIAATWAHYDGAWNTSGSS